MTYTNTPIVVSQQTTGYTSGNIPYSSIVLIASIPHAAQLEVERIFTQDRDGSTGPLLAFLADPAVTTAQKKAVFTIPISRCTLDSTTSNITAVDLPATGGTVYNYVITTPTPTTYTIKIPSLSQHGSSTVTVRRKTVSNEPFVNWVAGSRLTSKQLNLATTQSLYLIQEALEKIGTSVTIETTQITAASLSDNSVTTSAIASNAVTTAKIASGAVTSTNILDDTIVNADINASAGIVDTKLATISTAGKVLNSATTGVTTATVNTLVLRGTDGSITGGPLTGTTITGDNFVGYGTIPLGGIIMFSGSTLPSGWSLCTGQTVNSIVTPDLRNKFIVGTGTTYSIGNTGGSADAVVVSHTHTITDPTHTHNHLARNSDGGEGSSVLQSEFIGGSGATAYSNGIVANSTGITINTTGVSGTGANLPPYYALAFIMRTT